MIFVAYYSNAQIFRDTNVLKRTPAKDFRDFLPSAHLRFTSIIPGNFYTENMGIMCKQEKKFEKFSGIPFRFRLGNLPANDRLEGKRVPLTLN